MSWITTFSGKHIDPANPEPEKIDIIDIAHSLSQLCRGNGHTKIFFSVGQHCINCALEAKARGLSQRIILACLLHDASEAYLLDVPKPVKENMPDYREKEDRLLKEIYIKFLGRELTVDEKAIVKEIDKAMLYYDLKYLLNEISEEKAPGINIKLSYKFVPFEKVKNEYLKLFNKNCVISKNENMMQKFLNNQYDESNHILNWLKYWQSNDKRELDKMYYCGNPYADTIISMWQIMTSVYNKYNDKNEYIKEKSEKNINSLLDYFKSNDILKSDLQTLAGLAELRQNYILLPNRKMQRRGAWYADQLPPTLYQCFDDGKFSCYFDYDSKNVEKWVKEQHLEICFKDGIISRNNIIPMGENIPVEQCRKGTVDIEKVIDYSINFLQNRYK